MFKTSPGVYSGLGSGILGFTQVQVQYFSKGLLRFRFRTSARVFLEIGSGDLLVFSQVKVRDFS